jgi:hypothetical protein
MQGWPTTYLGMRELPREITKHLQNGGRLEVAQQNNLSRERRTTGFMIGATTKSPLTKLSGSSF